MEALVLNKASYFAMLVELMLDTMAIPVAVLNFYLLYKSAVLHVNLRWLMICQSISVLVFATARIPDILWKFISTDLYSEQSQILFALRILGMVLSGDIGIILIAERVIATCKARQYEHHYRKPSLAIIFIVIWILEAGAVTFAEANPWNSSSVYGIPESCTMMLAFCSLILGFASYVILVIIGYYNITAYHKTLIRPNSHSLTERYQLSENIRTSRQLHPALFLHFLEKFAAIGFVFISYYEIIKDPYWINFIRTLMYVVHGVCNFFIQVTVISYHPFLRRQASHLLSPILSRFKSATVDCDISLHEIDPNRTTTLPKINHALFAINRVQPSQSYSPSNDTDTHFKMLNDYWTVKTKSKT